MRVLFATTRGAGHVNPLVPFTEAALRGGHKVLVAGPQLLSETVERLGYMPAGPFRDAADLAGYLCTLLAAPDGLCLCVTDPGSGQQLGVVNYQANFPEHLKIELGGMWYSPVAQRTGANIEATYLMLEHAFGLGYRRLEWKCDALNERSRHAAERLGFTFEGIQDAHYIVKGRNRDTAWFRILEHEWPRVREGLGARLRP